MSQREFKPVTRDRFQVRGNKSFRPVLPRPVHDRWNRGGKLYFLHVVKREIIGAVNLRRRIQVEIGNAAETNPAPASGRPQKRASPRPTNGGDGSAVFSRNFIENLYEDLRRQTLDSRRQLGHIELDRINLKRVSQVGFDGAAADVGCFGKG